MREAYERNRQPEVLREASEHFARLTAGRYTRTWTSLGNRVLWVDDAAGKPLSVDKLSRGSASSYSSVCGWHSSTLTLAAEFACRW